MRKFIVEQVGYLQVEATRRFIVEVPDHFSDEETKELVEKMQDSLPDDNGMEWWDQSDRSWIGYDVEFDYTDVYDPDTWMGAPKMDALTVIRPEEIVE
jgi:hypothetical protein